MSLKKARKDLDWDWIANILVYKITKSIDFKLQGIIAKELQIAYFAGLKNK